MRHSPSRSRRIFFEPLEPRLALAAPAFPAISNQSVLGGAPLWLGIDGSDADGGTLTYSVSVANPSLLQAVVRGSSGRSNLKMDVTGFGSMVFQLFDDLAPRATEHIKSLASSGQLSNTASVPIKIYRVAKLASGENFVILGGRGGNPSTLGPFDDDYHPDLQFTSSGLLGMAKSTDDANDGEIFVSAGPARFLDFQHSILGVLTEGDDVRQAIHATRATGDGPPPTDIFFTSSVTSNDAENAALLLKAAEGASGTTSVTLTVRDPQNNEFSHTFQVTVAPDTANSAPFLSPIPTVFGSRNSNVTFRLTAIDVENNPSIFDASRPATESVPYTLIVNNSTGDVTITPPADFSGTFKVQVGVRGATPTTTADPFDTQLVTVVISNTPVPVLDLAATSDTGISSTDDITRASSLDFVISNVTASAAVQLVRGSTVLAQGVVAAGSTTITLTLPGSLLVSGVNAFTATQTTPEGTSASAPLNVTYDTTSPIFSSVTPTTAAVGRDLAYDAETNEESGGVAYALVNAPLGVTIHSTSGVISWTPTAAQLGPHNFAINATDLAGNVALQTVTLQVQPVASGQPQVEFTLQATRPDGTSFTQLTPGQDFVLHVRTRDLRTVPRGVFGAFLDVVWNSSLAATTGPIVFGSSFSNVRSGSILAGQLDEIGGVASLAELGAGTFEVLSVPMRALAPGTLVFSSNAADISPQHDVLVYGHNEAVPSSEVLFGGLTLAVAPEGTSGEVVPGVSVVENALLIFGTDRSDSIYIAARRNQFLVSGTLGSTRLNRAFPIMGIQRIIADLRGGNDSIAVNNNVRVLLVALGGVGDDSLIAGGGASVLSGGDGNDRLIGGGRRDVLLGGGGSDLLLGGGNTDLLIGGATTYDDTASALSAISREWNSSRTRSQRTANLRHGSGGILSTAGIHLTLGDTVLDDEAVDAVFGGADLDWFLQLGSGDRKDRTRKEPLG